MYTKWLVITVIALGVGIHHMSPALAQGQGEQEHKRKVEAELDSEKIAAFLNTTSEQDKSIQSIRQTYFTGLHAAKTDNSLSIEQVKERLRLLRIQAEKTLCQTLSADQILKLKFHGGFGILLGDAKPATPLDMLAKLGLTSDQKQKVEKLMVVIHREFDLLKQDGSATQDQLKLRMEGLHNRIMEELHSILTEDQKTRLHKMMLEHHMGEHSKTIPPTK